MHQIIHQPTYIRPLALRARALVRRIKELGAAREWSADLAGGVGIILFAAFATFCAAVATAPECPEQAGNQRNAVAIPQDGARQ